MKSRKDERITVRHKVDIDSLTEVIIEEIKNRRDGKNKFEFFSSSDKNVKGFLEEKGLKQDDLTEVDKTVTWIAPQNMPGIIENGEIRGVYKANHYLPVPYQKGITYMARNLAEKNGKFGDLADFTKEVLERLCISLEVSPDLAGEIINGRSWDVILPNIEKILRDLDNLQRALTMIDRMA